MKEKLEIEGMDEIASLIKKVETGYNAKILSVKKTTSDEFFGENKYDNREGFEVEFQLIEQPDKTWSEFFNIPKELGLSESKIMRFNKEYGELPKKDLIVKAIIIDGLFKVKLYKKKNSTDNE